MGIYKKIFSFIKPYWKHLLTVLMLTVIYVLFNNLSLWVSVDFINELFSPAYMQESAKTEEAAGTTPPDQQLKELLDSGKEVSFYKKMNYTVKSFIIKKDRKSTLIAVCVVIFLSYLFKNIALYLKQIILKFVEINMIVNMRNQIHERLMFLPLANFDKKHTGEYTSVVFNDVNSIKLVLHESFSQMVLSPIQILVNVVIMILISWKLSLFTFIVIPISTFVVVKIGQSMRRRSRRVLKQIANVMATFQEAVYGIRIVKLFTSEEREIEKFHETNRAYFQKTFRAQKLRFATSPINEIILVLVLVFLLWYGGNLVYANAGLNAEDFMRFLVFLFTIFQPIKVLSGVNNTIQSGVAAAERVFKILDMQKEVYEKENARKLETFSDKIEYRNVGFNYATSDKIILNDINLEIKKGETVAFVGHSGSGKTTIVNLLPRLYEVSQGAISIDNHDIRDYTLKSLRNHISIVTQDTVLFNDTIGKNIAYGVPDAGEEEIIAAAKAANAWEFIRKSEEGLNAHIGEKGARLSGGQKQRISIARAILRNPPILILDEATSALDTESERLVQDAINNIMENRTVLVIAHRLSTITHADKIVVLKHGRILATGNHEELLKTSEEYQKLYNIQFQTEVTPENYEEDSY